MPLSQKYRQIALDLDGTRVTLDLRPEELTWSEPSRVAVQNTLGSAWVDTFGPGIGTITIAGHSGWRGGHGMQPDGPEWLQAFHDLYQIAFKDWHAKVAATRDPEAVVLMFIDALDARVVRVVPGTFVLRRNKSRPLLMQYTITFFAVKDFVQGEGDDPSDEGDDMPLPPTLPAPDDAGQGDAIDNLMQRIGNA